MATTRQERNRAGSEMTEQLESLSQPLNDMLEYFRNYAREKPEAAMLWCFGIGFVLGWKLKPW
jgi:hypothetical protein